MKRLMTPVLVLLAAVLIVGAAYLGFNDTGDAQGLGAEAEPQAPPTVLVSRGNVQQTVIAPGHLESVKEVVLGMDVGGRLVEINVRPGDVVRQGDVLARLDTARIENTLQEARLRLETAQAEHARQLSAAELAVNAARLKLEMAQDEHTRRLAEAELALQSAESRLAQARLKHPTLTATEIRLQNAIETEAEAETEYREALERQQANWEPEEVTEGYQRALEAAQDEHALAQAAYDAARRAQAASGESFKDLQAEIERARIELARLQAGVDLLLALELEKAQTTLADLVETGVDPLLELALQKAQADLDAATLVAPFDGTVLEVNARPGATIAPGADLMVLTDPSAAEVYTTVIEEDLPLVQVAQAAELFFDAQPQAAVQGRVARIVPQRVRGEDRPLYPVYVTPDELPPGLLPGMTVDASIIIAQQTDVLRLPRALVRGGKVEVWAGGQVQERHVQIGLRGDVYVEILDGLSEGELVVGR
jgi:HlyD family secretion protein